MVTMGTQKTYRRILLFFLCAVLLLFAFTSNALVSNVSAETTITSTADLKIAIENATTDTVLNLAPGTFQFEMSGGATPEIKNTNNVKVTLIGATDAVGNPMTKFSMDSGVTQGARFIRVSNGTLDVQNISFTGTKDKNGGVAANNVTAKNCEFTKNYTTDGVAGGGAIHVGSGNMHIENCTFSENSCASTSDGGAVAAQYAGNVYINNSKFDNNSRTGNNNQYGGAVSIKQPGVSGSTIKITNCAFTNNIATGSGSWTRGGAIHIYSTAKVSSIEIDNVLFKENSCSTNNGGALAFMDTTNAKITNCTFVDNSAYKYGGGVYFENSDSVDNTIENCTFLGNKYTYIIGSGSAISAYSSKVKVDSCTIIGNTLSVPGTNSKITIRDSVITDATNNQSAAIVYEGVNIAKKSSSESTVLKANVLTAYTIGTLQKNSDYNYTAPVKVDGPAFKAISDTRSSTTAQNGVARKSPLSDAGAHEAAELESFEVTFDAQGGSPEPAPQTVADGSKLTEPAAPSKLNHTFAGWYTAANGGDLWNFDGSTVEKSMTLYAHWEANSQYTITYHNNDGTGNVADPDSPYFAGVEVTVLDRGNIQRPDYTFAGWNIEADGSGAGYAAGDTFDMPAENVDLYAQWQPQNSTNTDTTSDPTTQTTDNTEQSTSTEIGTTNSPTHQTHNSTAQTTTRPTSKPSVEQTRQPTNNDPSTEQSHQPTNSDPSRTPATQTGDDSNMALYIGIAVLAALVAAGVAISAFRKRRNK